jgi:hypothetical protein
MLSSITPVICPQQTVPSGGGVEGEAEGDELWLILVEGEALSEAEGDSDSDCEGDVLILALWLTEALGLALCEALWLELIDADWLELIEALWLIEAD